MMVRETMIGGRTRLQMEEERRVNGQGEEKLCTGCCSWDGITCDEHTNQVIQIHLRSSQLNGRMNPKSSLFHLVHLHVLDLAQQIGSGMNGLGLGALTLDWSAVASFLSSPLISPFFAIANTFVGYAFVVYVAIPIAYWGFNLYGANKFPVFSSDLFTAQGQQYNISAIVNDKFEIDLAKYHEQGRINMSMFFALSYGFGFATIASTITHVVCFYGREIMERYRSSTKGKKDIHTKLMKNYKDKPSWWFYLLLGVTLIASFMIIITATTNQTPGLNIITEYIFGLIYPGRPIANVCFKTYGYISMAQAVSFLGDFKLGHYMKIPPRSMFLVQFIGTVLAGTINISVAWWLLESVNNICNKDLLPEGSPWTCPSDRVFFDASVIWGLIGPKRIFGSLGDYSAMNWFFLGERIGGRDTTMFYQQAASLDAGVAFMAVLLYFAFGLENVSLHWWGTAGEHCPLATCPTTKGSG
ncbi:hypothetical protein TSUD_61790 [Trifolium subterraneum]|uniref:Uncharacterized protein n=1 Tax=Trifolium subterraneum TaxID=3900 RepID=A0A2Z6N0F7_TRISU|nr:hypothetical protein TSUD_61790 [Trifolium subterraneum]